MKIEIKEIVETIDALADTVKRSNGPSRQLIAAYDSLIFAKAWLGKTLNEFGELTPYKNDGNRKTVDDIEPVAIKANFNYKDETKDMGLIELVDWLREMIEGVIKTLFELKAANANQLTYKANIYTTECFTDLTRAKMWLGFELGRIRDSNLATTK